MSDRAVNDRAREMDRPDVEAMTFEAAIGELEDIVDKLEKGNVPLDGAPAFRGEVLTQGHDEVVSGAREAVEGST